ncbi:hypothetical protein [Paenibacillus vini]|uniref:DUF2642 domain-containing protein n=1 Tax=Paenibacillus vini TaxID=1476024 RepID=A0ABQ4MGG2_9BACL|nr:hypothetical protein [Paenibacillus vini]GIP55042.1 hypothetical protein J42TS3_40770 [Paenibacillus vini]
MNNTYASRVATLIGQNVQVTTSVDTITGTLVSSDKTFIKVNTGGVDGSEGSKTVSILTSVVAYIRVV